MGVGGMGWRGGKEAGQLPPSIPPWEKKKEEEDEDDDDNWGVFGDS